MSLNSLDVYVSHESVADMTDASYDEIEQAEAMLDQVLDNAVAEEFEEVEHVTATLASFDSIEPYDENGDPVNPDGEIAQRVGRTVSNLKAQFAKTIEHAKALRAELDS